jgi:hypothetical protein
VALTGDGLAFDAVLLGLVLALMLVAVTSAHVSKDVFCVLM